MSHTPLIIGHRGAPGYRPEHSPSSYRFALELGVDAVEPDIVVSSDGVLVVRHENEISGTTDVADHPEFADRRTTKSVDGELLTGWFTEDFTWAELATLRTRERIPLLRPESAAYDDQEPMLRLVDLLELIRAAATEQGRPIGAVIEIKHATYFARLGLDQVPLLLRDLAETGWDRGELPLTIESFEQGVLMDLQRADLSALFIYLLEESGTAFDLRAGGPSYLDQRSPAGLDRLAAEVDGISLDKHTILQPDKHASAHAPGGIVAAAHERGLLVFTWTARPENVFLLEQFRRGSEEAAFGDYRAEWELLRASGIDGVFVDHADLGIDVFRA